jgi:hypothetical protein
MSPSGSRPKRRIEPDRMLSGSRLATPPPAEADQAFSLPFGVRGLQSKRVRRGAAPALLLRGCAIPVGKCALFWQFCSNHVEAGRRQALLRLGPFDFLLNIICIR